MVLYIQDSFIAIKKYTIIKNIINWVVTVDENKIITKYKVKFYLKSTVPMQTTNSPKTLPQC